MNRRSLNCRMGYLTNLLLLSAGLFLVSGSSVPKGFWETTKHKGRMNRRGVAWIPPREHGADYNEDSANGQDYFIGGLIGPAIESAMPTVVQHIETALPGLIERNLPTIMDQALPIFMDRLEKDLPGLIDRFAPILIEKAQEHLPALLAGGATGRRRH